MPKDIRSYFNVSPKTAKQPSEDNKKKKAKKIIISDSESEDEIVETKTKKVSPNKPSAKPSVKIDRRKNKKEEESEYFKNLKPINPADVLGSGSIKRSGVPIKKKGGKGNIKNDFNDDDFDETFLQLDDKSVELLIEENAKKNSSKNDLLSSNSKLDQSPSRKKTPETKKAPFSGNNSITDFKNSRTVQNEILKNQALSSKSESLKNDCLVLSESSDSECDSTPAKKVKRETRKTTSINESPNKKNLMQSPEKKSAKMLEKQPTSETKKNECMVLSESDSEEETFSNTNDKGHQNYKDKSSDQLKSSEKGTKLIKFNESPKPGHKRQRIDRFDSDDELTNQKKLKKEINDKKPSPSKVNSYVPQMPIVSNLWVDKYRPTNLKQLIGQQGDKSNVQKLITWLKNWRKNHNGKTKLYRPSPWAKDDDGSFFKAALLSGPPGVGKTTTADLVCKELGFDVVEFNASDTRSKKSLQQEVSELLSTKSLAPFFSGGRDQEVSSRHVLLMDEVDGMAGNEDRGGMQELIQLIKSSRVPVICMCNDRNHPKIRSLVNYCFDLRFSRPRVEQIKGAMMSVCFKEGLTITPEQLTDVIKSTNQDIRLVLNHLSVLAAQKDCKLPNSEKFVKLGPWDVVRKVFSEEELKKMSFYDKSDLFFHDYGIAPLFVQENYLSVVPHAKLNKIEKIKVFSKASESICYGDIIEKVIRTSNAWSLLPVEAIFASVVPGETLKGHIGGQINFPSWLGKNSTKNKMDRLQQEILVHTRLKVSGSKQAINLDYSSHLRDLIVRPLIQNGSEGVQDALNSLQSYDLLKEDLESLSELCKWPNKKDPMDKVESKVKAAFTRAYNKSSALSPYAVTAIIKKGRGGVAGMDASNLLGEDDSEDTMLDEKDEDEDSIEVDAMIMAKKKTSKKPNAPSTSKQSGTGKRGGRGGKKIVSLISKVHFYTITPW